MPKQEMFFTQQAGDLQVEVLKTYDQKFAREVFDSMDLEAQKRLWADLAIADKHEPEDMPRLDDQDGEESLWDELVDAAKEDWNSVSFFVVMSATGKTSKGVYVSPDWPSAEAVAKSLISGSH
jgi:hypothetical protein